MVIRPLATVLMIAGGLSAADPSLLNLMPPQAESLFGMDVSRVMASPFGQFLFAQSQKPPLLDMIKTAGLAGFNPLRDLQAVVMATAPGMRNPLIAARGTYNVAAIIETLTAAGYQVETYEGVQILETVAHGSGGVLAFPDNNMAIVGDLADVRAAIARREAAPAIDAALGAEAKTLSQDEDVWGVSLNTSFSDTKGPLALLHDVHQMSGGIQFGGTVTLHARAVCADSDQAAALANSLHGIDVFLHDKFTPLKNLTADVNGSAVSASIALSEQEFEKLIASAF